MTAVEALDMFRIYPSAEGAAAALQGLTLEIEEGELVVVFGPSGSGKSTLLRILAGLDRPSAGTVRVFEHDLRTLRGRELAKYRSHTLGYADQHYSRALAPELTARQLVALRLELLGADPVANTRTADRLLERVGLTDKRNARPGELSGGQQQRIALCAALSHGPKLFIADEPTGELDAANATEIYRLIGELTREAGTTTLIVSHDPESASVADRVVQVRDGRVSSETRTDGETHAVVNRGGWIRIPEDVLGATTRARVESAPEGVLVHIDAAPSTRHPPRVQVSARGGDLVAEAFNLAKVHGSGAHATEVFRDLSFEVRAGELLAVTGPSGSGKSTLLQLLAGLDRPTAGEIHVLGTALSELDDTRRALLRRGHIGLVTQGTDLVPFLSARETVELALALRGLKDGEVTTRATTALAAVGLTELADQHVARLSMGERQRVAIARALAAKPAILLADEPTARLDEGNSRAVGALFADLATTIGAAIVCATHDPVLIEHASAEVPLATLARHEGQSLKAVNPHEC